MSQGMTATRGADLFGTIAVAMVTPFTAAGELDVAAARALAAKLVTDGCDCLVLNGTTGESPVTTIDEKLLLIREVRKEIGDRAKIIAGSGSYDTRSSVNLSRLSADSGADGLLVVTPYYSKPPQDGVYRHFQQVAEATDLPVMLYDIPGRTATPIAPDTIRRLAELPTVKAVKDAKGDMNVAAELIDETGLAWYSGDDPLNLTWLAVGATGFISVIGHVAADRLRTLREDVDRGDLVAARATNKTLIPLMRAQAMLGGVSFAKAALPIVAGLDVGIPRLPQIPAEGEKLLRLRTYLNQAGVEERK